MELRTTLEQLRDCEAALTAAHERETALREENERLTAAQGPRERFKSLTLRADTAEAALAEAQLEREYNKTGWVNCGSMVNKAQSALTAERQKVTALRDYATRRQDEAQRKSYVVYESSYEQGLQTAYGNVIDEMDALGLTTQPPQDAEPAT